MPSKRSKIILGAAGTVVAGIISWRAFFPWIGYDLKMIKCGLKAAGRTAKDIASGRFIINMFEEAVQTGPKKPFVIFEDRVYSYKFMDQQADRVANIAAQWGLQVGQCVAIMIENEPSFIWTFLGLQKLGIAVAFINYNVKGLPLVHTINACEANALIIGQADHIIQAVEEVKSDLKDLPVYVQGQYLPLGDGYQSWDQLMMNTHPVPVCKYFREGLGINTPCCYIFTSGTTGLPKPAILAQGKCVAISKFLQLFDFLPSDILYTTTPLYHSAAGAIGLMNTIDQGATMVLRRKFSAHHFFEDVRKHNCTVIQYIGELCRYVLAVPPTPLDGTHKVRVAVGNGLRTDIWEQFQYRFKIPQICEFFGATEGPTAIMNLSNRVGACGRYSPLLNKLDPIPKLLVKFDVESGQAVRGKNGFCIPVGIGETGLVLISIPSLRNLQFYKAGREVNEQKVLRNVLREGDCYFNYGDLLSIDKDYFAYFKDRLGDTFRWKGENVATLEVANVLTQLDFVQDANVYGVEVPGKDGRAGMAAIHLEDKLQVTPKSLQDIYNHCVENLPNYARPIFLRFPQEPSITVTLKQQKIQLRKEGFNPELTEDPLFYLDETNKTYSPLTVKTYPQFLAKSRL